MARQPGQRRSQAARRSYQRGERRARNQGRKARRRVIYTVTAGIIAVLIIGSFVVSAIPGGGLAGRAGGSGATSYENGVGVPQTLMPTANHLDGQTIAYSTTPPTSGDHWSASARCGFYESEVRDETTGHNLEHGNVVMSYNLTDPADITRLEEVHDNLTSSGSWLVTRPYSKIPEGAIAMAAWGVLDQFTGIDEERIERFFDAYKGNRFSEEAGANGGMPCL